jgi:hypothetical protein
MAKDPAVLFYTSDFLTGTFTMNYEQRGKYITLLCLQHQQGFLTDEDLKNVLDDTDLKIFSKFEKLSDGLFYNIKLKNESERRKSYTESRRNNRQGKTKDKINISKSYDKLMETVTVTGTGTDTLELKLVTGNITKAERQNELAETMANTWEQLTKTI